MGIKTAAGTARISAQKHNNIITAVPEIRLHASLIKPKIAAPAGNSLMNQSILYSLSPFSV